MSDFNFNLSAFLNTTSTVFNSSGTWVSASKLSMASDITTLKVDTLSDVGHIGTWTY